MEIFDKRFVHFMWDDELEGKECFLDDNVDDLKYAVEVNNDGLYRKVHFGECNRPFDDGSCLWRFAYYDPNYFIKKAFNEGKIIQYQLIGEDDWRDVGDEESLLQYIEEERTFRIKPEEYKWVVYLARPENGDCYLTACRENRWEFVQKDYHAKTKLFVGSENEVVGWYRVREKFTETIKSWEDGETIQYLDESTKTWMDIPKDYNIAWFVDREYRVKLECPCADGIDFKACVGCEHSEDGKPRINKNYAEGACKDCLERKKYRPYESSAEMIADFINKFKVNCPTYRKPLIWVRLKVDKRERLIVAYGDNFVEIGNKTKAVTLQHLFEQYEFLDGCVIGVKNE